jgi:hypothetical protein
MDISTIYAPTAVEALTPAIQGRNTFSPLADIKISLSMISDALDNGHEFPEESIELIPVEIPTGAGTGIQPAIPQTQTVCSGCRSRNSPTAVSRSACRTRTARAK